MSRPDGFLGSLFRHCIYRHHTQNLPDPPESPLIRGRQHPPGPDPDTSAFLGPIRRSDQIINSFYPNDLIRIENDSLSELVKMGTFLAWVGALMRVNVNSDITHAKYKLERRMC